jgi:hypothetical protein
MAGAFSGLKKSTTSQVCVQKGTQTSLLLLLSRSIRPLRD